MSPIFQRVAPAPAATTSPAISSPGMSDAPGGGGYMPCLCITSGRLTPAAATRTSTSPGPGAGTGRTSGTRTSGPPGDEMPTTVMLEGIVPDIGVSFVCPSCPYYPVDGD